jgi:lipopolysaccharide assembly outer membrane protein LptD (OstA)
MKQVHAHQTEMHQEQKELTAKQKVQIQDTEDNKRR